MSISFRLFLVWTFILFARPQDFLYFLAPLRFALVFTILTLIATLGAKQNMTWGKLLKIGIARKYIILYILMIIGIPFANHQGRAFNWIFFSYIINMQYFYIAVVQLDSAKKIKATVYVISICLLFYGIFGMATGQMSEGGRYAFGNMFDPNDIALFMVGLSPMSIVFLRKTNKMLSRVMAALVIVVALLIIVMSGSRGGLLSLVVVFLIFFLTKVGAVKRSYKVAVVGLLIGLFFIYSDKLNLDRYDTLLDVEEDYNVTSDTGRIEVWKTALELIAANPITGVGAGCFPRAFGYYRAAEGREPTWKAAHNSYVEIWSEVGYPGIIVIMMIIFGCIKNYARAMKMKPAGSADDDIPFLSGLVLIGFAGHLVGAFFLSQAYGLQFTLFFALAAALENCYLRGRDKGTF